MYFLVAAHLTHATNTSKYSFLRMKKEREEHFKAFVTLSGLQPLTVKFPIRYNAITNINYYIF